MSIKYAHRDCGEFVAEYLREIPPSYGTAVRAEDWIVLGEQAHPMSPMTYKCPKCEGEFVINYVFLREINAESDPNGLKASDPGAKLDAGKNRLGLVLLDFRHALKAVGEVGTYGAIKYSEHGWLDVPNGRDRYIDAMLRHLLADEVNDPATGLPHLAHAAWNVLAALELMVREER